MEKQIKLNYEGSEYTLCFNREAVVDLERKGFNFETLNDKPLESVMLLVNGAFYVKHSNISKTTIEKIYSAIPNKTQFINKLAEMYRDTLESLFGDSNEGNAKWEGNW